MEYMVFFIAIWYNEAKWGSSFFLVRKFDIDTMQKICGGAKITA